MQLLIKKGFVILAALLLCVSTGSATAEKSLTLVAPTDLQPLVKELVAAYERDSEVSVSVHCYPDEPEQRRQLIATLNGSVLIADFHPMKHALEDGEVVGTVRPLFYKRLAIGVVRKNPNLLFSLADLGKPGVRVGFMKPGHGDLATVTDELLQGVPEREAIEKNVVLRADRFDDLAEALKLGRCDAVIGWDTLENFDPDHISMVRLAGPYTKGVNVGLLKQAAEDQAAADLVNFLASGENAEKAFRNYGYSLNEDPGVRYRDSLFFKNFHTHRYYYIYQLLAQQVIDDYDIIQGTYVDVGCGGGQMLINMARISELECVGVDIEPEILSVARKNVADAGFDKRIRFVSGDVHNIPLPDNYADMVFSRGSIPFWRDRVKAFQEIYRVLKPGGIAFIGGGGSRYLTEDYYKQIKAPWVTPKERKKFNIPKFASLDEILSQTGIPTYRIIQEGGHWAEIRK